MATRSWSLVFLVALARERESSTVYRSRHAFVLDSVPAFSLPVVDRTLGQLQHHPVG